MNTLGIATPWNICNFLVERVYEIVAYSFIWLGLSTGNLNEPGLFA